MKKILLIAVMTLAAASAFAQPKFAHVKFSELIQLSPDADQARAKIQTAQNEAQETFKAMYDEYQGKAQQYQQKSATWTPAIKESKERELQDMQQRLQEFDQNVQQELQQQQQQLMAPIYQKVTEIVSKLAKEGKYIYVFDVTSVAYIDDTQSVDLTPAARAALNIPDGRTLESLQKEIQEQQATAQTTK